MFSRLGEMSTPEIRETRSPPWPGVWSISSWLTILEKIHDNLCPPKKDPVLQIGTVATIRQFASMQMEADPICIDADDEAW